MEKNLSRAPQRRQNPLSDVTASQSSLRRTTAAAIRRTSVWLALAPLCLVFFSCSFDYQILAEDPADSTPDIVMTDVEYVRVENGKPRIRLQAQSLERYEKKQQMVMIEPRFKQLNQDNGISGMAGQATMELGSGNVTLEGAVRIAIPEEKALLETNSLFWLDKEKKLRSQAGTQILVKKEDGSYLVGTDFSADAREKTWKLESGVSGAFVEEKEEEQQHESP